jgi:anthranilate phosphoribosyltransferase
MVVFGRDGLDEISIGAPTYVCELKGGKTKTYEITPEQFGFKRSQKSEIVGGDKSENARITRQILGGQKGAKRDAVVLNAAAAVYVAGKCPSIKDAVSLVSDTIDSGRALSKLNEFIKYSNEL